MLMLMLLTTVNVLYFRNISSVLYLLGLAFTMGLFGAIYALSDTFKLVYFLFLIALLAYQFLLNNEIALAFYIQKIEYEFYTTKLWHIHPEIYFFIRYVFLKHNKQAANPVKTPSTLKKQEEADLQYYKMLIKEFDRAGYRAMDEGKDEGNRLLITHND